MLNSQTRGETHSRHTSSDNWAWNSTLAPNAKIKNGRRHHEMVFDFHSCFGALRFYRLQTNHDMTPELCFEFCIGAGLDLFGLVGEECRCGASLLNKDVWQMAAPRTTGLLLPLSEQLPEPQMECPVRVYHWLGPFVSGGSVPEHLQMLQHGSILTCLAIKIACLFLLSISCFGLCILGCLFSLVSTDINSSKIKARTTQKDEPELWHPK